MTAVPRTDPFLTLLGALLATGAARLHNARGGFACNSSSSHSIVVVPDGHTLTDEDPGDEFGWNDFALTDSGDKIRYLAAMLNSRPDLADVVADLCDEHDITLSEDAYVDHESHLTFPTDFYGTETDREFLTDFATLLTDPRVAILGGNDNDGATDHMRADMVRVAVDGFAGWRARKDTTGAGTWWVLFNTFDGTKVRISLDIAALRDGAQPQSQAYGPEPMEPAEFTPAKAATPELVDVKLTDRCPFETDCSWCYMGSTRDGVEGDPAAVANLLTALSRLRVFEVAFGGGEPTVWPAFTQTLAFARSVGITPNFTTKNYAWLTGPNAATWLDLVGAVAFSVNTRTAMDRLVAKAEAADLSWTQHRKITVQLIPDLVPTADFRHIVTTATDRGWRVTLLGYKTTGRGTTFTPAFRRPPGWWLTACADLPTSRRLATVAIDTALAEQSAAALTAAGVPEWMYHLEEGRFSAYVDAVTARMGPSSYGDPADLRALDLHAPADELAETINATFATYLPERRLLC